MTKFKEGAPCKNGHTLKYVETGSCVVCAKARDKTRHRFVDHHTLTNKILNIPDVVGLFWKAKNGTRITV